MEGIASVLPGFQGRQFRPAGPDIRYMFICHRYYDDPITQKNGEIAIITLSSGMLISNQLESTGLTVFSSSCCFK
jgi:hypothetical protein